MNSPSRGETKKERVLKAACKVFAEKGYRDATHAEICRRAGANVAAVNYYFTSKESLYKAVFQHLTQESERLYPLDGGLPVTEPPEQRLHAFIHAHLSRMFDPERLGDLHRIRMAELFDPTGLLKEMLARQLARDREHIQRILREMLGPDAPPRAVDWCEMSIVAQCFIAGRGPADRGPRAMFGLHPADVRLLARHILEFSLGGIRAVRRPAADSGHVHGTGAEPNHE